MLQRADFAGYAGTDYDQFLVAECALAVLAGLHRDAAIQQRGNLIAQLVLALGVADGDARAARFQEQRRGHARLAQPNHQNSFAFDFHGSFPAFEQSAFQLTSI